MASATRPSCGTTRHCEPSMFGLEVSARPWKGHCETRIGSSPKLGGLTPSRPGRRNGAGAGFGSEDESSIRAPCPFDCRPSGPSPPSKRSEATRDGISQTGFGVFEGSWTCWSGAWDCEEAGSILGACCRGIRSTSGASRRSSRAIGCGSMPKCVFRDEIGCSSKSSRTARAADCGKSLNLTRLGG